MDLQRMRRTLGLGLMGSSMLLAVVAPLAGAAEVAEDRTTVPVEDIARQAFWNGDTSESTPTAVTKQFPPEAVCLVAPNLCNFPTGDEDPSSELPTGQLDPTADEDQPTEDGLGALGNSLIASMNEAYTGGVNQVQEGDPGSPADPVPDGSLPVSIAFGQAYYRAAIEFPLPEVPAGDQVDEFIVYFQQGNPTYSNASPALRQAVLATLTCARESDEAQGRCQNEEFEKVAERELRDDEPLPFQLCPIGADPVSGEDDPEWEAGGSKDEDTLPTANCLLGALASQVDIGGETYWAFDLSLALDAWSSGDLPYEGMIFLPGSAENFAFGDAETTYSKQVTMLNENIQYALATSPAPEPPAPFVPPSGGFTTTTTTTNTGSGELFGTPPTPAANSPVSVPQSSTPPATTEQQPAVATDDGSTGGQPTDVVAQPAAAPGGSDWYVWLLLLPFALGAYMLSKSLQEEAVLVAERSGGAMTRLLERQAAQRAPDLVGR